MISKLLLIVSLTLTIIPYILLLITYISSKKEKKITASENILKILENDSSINFIENKESIFSHYNIKRKIYIYPIIIWIILVMYGRIVFGAHFLSDTCAGAIIGTACVYWGYLRLQRRL